MSDDDPFLGREMQKSRSFSEHTMEVIDEEVHRILSEAQVAANELLLKHRDDLQAITDGLLKKEELDRYEIEDLIGPSVHGETVRPGKTPNEPSKNGSVSSDDEKSDADSESSEAEKETASDKA